MTNVALLPAHLVAIDWHPPTLQDTKGVSSNDIPALLLFADVEIVVTVSFVVGSEKRGTTAAQVICHVRVDALDVERLARGYPRHAAPHECLGVVFPQPGDEPPPIVLRCQLPPYPPLNCVRLLVPPSLPSHFVVVVLPIFPNVLAHHPVAHLPHSPLPLVGVDRLAEQRAREAEEAADELGPRRGVETERLGVAVAAKVG
mmetsp:Transcript_17549/g.37955  ORF Transcript_17549/g.37955 Transcript_17549/m.37955 type:complete len:201 (-) Transcript_17549:452-1054(-)